MARGTPLKLQNAVVDVLIERRKKLGLSHEKLATLAGVTRPAISFVESGKRNPTLLMCLKLAQALNCPLSEILAAAERPRTAEIAKK